MITRIDFDRIIVVAGAKSLGSGEPAQDLREQTFHARDGWDIRESLPGVFSLHRGDMLDPVTIVGVGASFVRKFVPPETAEVDVRCMLSSDQSVTCKLGTVSCVLPHGWPSEKTKEQLAAVVPSKGKRR